jgi:hypothetical protein
MRVDDNDHPEPPIRERKLQAQTARGASLLLALAIAASAMASVAAARTAAVPRVQKHPEIVGKAQVGVTLHADAGTWTGSNPISYTYDWRICNENGGACHSISGATGNEYAVKADDAGNTLRVRVTAKNAEGSNAATSVPSAVIAPATTTPAPAPTGCATKGGTVAIAGITPPARLNIDQFQVSPSTITYATRTLTVRFHVTACGGSVQGALIYATAVPYGMFQVPNEQSTGADGWATLDFVAQAGFPVSQKQQLLVMFVRARKADEDILGGISSRRLISFKVVRG